MTRKRAANETSIVADEVLSSFKDRSPPSRAHACRCGACGRKCDRAWLRLGARRAPFMRKSVRRPFGGEWWSGSGWSGSGGAGEECHHPG